MIFDSFFTYKYALRFLLLHKIGTLDNTHKIPHWKKIQWFFSLKKLEDIDEVQLYNNFYLFKFFFGRNAFFGKTKKFFSLGTWYYSFSIQLFINNSKDISFLLFFFFNNILINIDKNLIKIGLLNRKLNLFTLIVKDLNIYSELKTNLGLFNIKNPLNLKLFFSGCDSRASKMLLNSFKCPCL